VETEQIDAVGEVLSRLGFRDFKILLNHRRVLMGLLEVAEIPREQHETALVALDKWDKIGDAGVEAEFAARNVDAQKATRMLSMLRSIFGAGESASARIATLRDLLGSTAHVEAVEQLTEILRLVTSDIAEHIYIDPRLARGLSYYTGAIMEI